MPGLEVQLGARLSNFERGMERAVSIAEQAVGEIERKFSDLNPSLGSLAGISAIAGGLTGLIAFAERMNRELAEMDRRSREVGLSLERFQGVQFAAASRGVDNADFAAGLDRAVSLLNDAQRNSNSLSQIFAANGLAIRQTNGELITTNQLLKSAADLVSRARTEQDKIKVAQLTGFGRELLPVLREGGDAFERMAGEAEKLGIIIEQETIEKARRFSEEWTRSTSTLSFQIRAVAADASVFISELIDKVQAYAAALAAANGVQGDQGQQQFNAVADALSIVAKEAAGVAQNYDQVTAALERMRAKPIPDQEIISALEAIQAQAKATADELNRANAGRAALLGAVSAENFPGGVPLPSARPRAAQQAATVIPARDTGTGGGRDAFDATVDQANRRIAVLNAETQTIGLNTEARERARLVAILEEAAKRANTEAGLANTAATAEQRAQIEQLADAMERAARQHRLLSEAMASFRDLGNAASEAFKGLVIEGKKFDEVLQQLLNRLASRAIDSLFDRLFTGLGASLLGGGTGLGSLFGGGRAAGGSVSAGRMYVVGENGPELFAPNQSGRIIPNSMVQQSNGAGFTYAPVIDARGADQAAVDRLETIVVAQSRTMEQMVRAQRTSARQSRTGVG